MWSGDLSEPQLLVGKSGPVSLRSIHASFIDNKLKEIEETAATWAKEAILGLKRSERAQAKRLSPRIRRLGEQKRLA